MGGRTAWPSTRASSARRRARGKVTVERGPVSTFAACGQDNNPVYRNARGRDRGGLRPHPRAADVHVRGAVLGRVRRRPAAPTRPAGAEPDAHDHGRAVRARARSCCTASRSSRTTAPSRSATCSTARQTITDIYEKDTDTRDDDLRRHGDASGPTPSSRRAGRHRAFNLIARLQEVAHATTGSRWVVCRTRSRSSPAPGRASASRTRSGSSPRARRSSSPRSTRTAPSPR